MVDILILQRFLIALALGALIGLEREYARFRNRGHDFAGIRTFPLISLVGALSAYLGDILSPLLLLAGMVLMGILIIVAYFIIAEKSRAHFGATSEIAGFLAFFIGVLCYYEEFFFAIVLAVSITVILYARSILHDFAEHLTRKEVSDTLKFAVIAFLVLPLLPNRGFGPLGLFNPYLTWLMVVFISGISFAGYIAMKWFGEHGITLAGLLGGMASSTATTTNFAQRSSKELRIYKALALGVILANGVMFIRVLIEVFVVNPDLFTTLLLPMSILVFVTAAFSYFLWKKSRSTKGKIELESPFTLLPALKFAAIFTLVIALAKLADIYLSSQGVYLVSFLSGFADVDAVTLSLSQLAKTSLAAETARNGIVIATLTNVAVKGGIAYWLGGKEFGKLVLSFFGALVVVGTLLIFFL